MVKILIQHFRIQTIKYSKLENKQAKQQKQAQGVSETLAEISSGAEQSAASIQAIVSAVDTTTSIASEVEES